MEYNFEQYKSPHERAKAYCGISLSKNGIYISKDARKVIASGDRFTIYYDKENKSIKFQATEEGFLLYDGIVSNIKLSRYMPQGRYELVESGEKTWIFLYAEKVEKRK